MVSTIKEGIARAGVSISTVSKVLSNYSNIIDETRQKVLNAVKKLTSNSSTRHNKDYYLWIK